MNIVHINPHKKKIWMPPCFWTPGSFFCLSPGGAKSRASLFQTHPTSALSLPKLSGSHSSNDPDRCVLPKVHIILLELPFQILHASLRKGLSLRVFFRKSSSFLYGLWANPTLSSISFAIILMSVNVVAISFSISSIVFKKLFILSS